METKNYFFQLEIQDVHLMLADVGQELFVFYLREKTK
jgi:hypothetical protein